MTKFQQSVINKGEPGLATTPFDDLLLYHGTTFLRLVKIVEEDVLEISPIRTCHVSLTTDPVVAAYFANNSSFADKSFPVTITLSLVKLLGAGYELEAFSDPIWGFGECDWEQEICCLQNIEPLSDVLAAPPNGGLMTAKMLAAQQIQSANSSRK